MILLTIGSHEPFDRLVETIDTWCTTRDCGNRVFGQITEHAGYVPSSFQTVAMLDPIEYRERCQTAELIVSHAGMGSIITAMSLGKPILVMPRRAHLGETRNDHQYATATRFRDHPSVYVAMDERELPAVLDALLNSDSISCGSAIPAFAQPHLIETLRSFIHECGSPDR